MMALPVPVYSVDSLWSLPVPCRGVAIEGDDPKHVCDLCLSLSGVWPLMEMIPNMSVISVCTFQGCGHWWRWSQTCLWSLSVPFRVYGYWWRWFQTCLWSLSLSGVWPLMEMVPNMSVISVCPFQGCGHWWRWSQTCLWSLSAPFKGVAIDGDDLKHVCDLCLSLSGVWLLMEMIPNMSVISVCPFQRVWLLMEMIPNTSAGFFRNPKRGQRSTLYQGSPTDLHKVGACTLHSFHYSSPN